MPTELVAAIAAQLGTTTAATVSSAIAPLVASNTLTVTAVAAQLGISVAAASAAAITVAATAGLPLLAATALLATAKVIKTVLTIVVVMVVLAIIIVIVGLLVKIIQTILSLGDITDHGGRVISAFAGCDFNGIPSVGIGDKVYCPCPDCQGVYSVIEGAGGMGFTQVPITLTNMKTSCGASLIGSQGGFGFAP
ncbi:PAAR domain-containing protein [Entomomonas sp. E2T0]|uniref:PAAR domain-containing protein n=1 Tax=Entomomonas sp. E2T0 TaxID=2930213 RepID=UPI00222824D0|nr:PAAR domain-containing protein [Entomomonas sp. E2T0]UYZ83585.1 PAAR domain-containing protein [Entomomonas sp. E2T0]